MPATPPTAFITVADSLHRTEGGTTLSPFVKFNKEYSHPVHRLSSGVYFASVTHVSGTKSYKMMLLK